MGEVIVATAMTIEESVALHDDDVEKETIVWTVGAPDSTLGDDKKQNSRRFCFCAFKRDFVF